MADPREAGKQAAARRALELVEDRSIIGVGTGSTVAYFIEALGAIRHRIEATVSSSEQTTARLQAQGIRVVDLNSVGPFTLYIDGADECDPRKRLIKGGGGALTREKILAAVAKTFVCMVDSTKRVAQLGKFALPIEVIPMARGHVAREIVQRGGNPVWRDGFVTDNGNCIIDVHGWQIADPIALEADLNQIVGVVCVGLFARRAADVVLVGDTVMP